MKLNLIGGAGILKWVQQGRGELQTFGMEIANWAKAIFWCSKGAPN